MSEGVEVNHAFPIPAAAVKWDCHKKKQLNALSSWLVFPNLFTALCHYKQVGKRMVIQTKELV